MAGSFALGSLACGRQSVDAWHAKLRVGQTSELVVESPRARDPSANDSAPAARLWVAVDSRVEPRQVVVIGKAWRAHYVETDGDRVFVSESVTGSAIYFEDEQGQAHLSLDFRVLDPIYRDVRPPISSFDGYLPVVVERTEGSPHPPVAKAVAGPRHPSPPPNPPDWRGGPAPTFSPSVPDDLPPELRFEAKRAPPSGYRHARIESYTLEIVGGSIFLGAYLATVGIASIDGFEHNQGWLAVPVAGPFVWWRRQNPPSNRPQEGYYLQGIEPFLIAAPQLTGLGILLGGLLEPPDDRWVREDLSDNDVSFRLTPVPVHSGFELVGAGRF